jgi:hypothetical protein
MEGRESTHLMTPTADADAPTEHRLAHPPSLLVMSLRPSNVHRARPHHVAGVPPAVVVVVMVTRGVFISRRGPHVLR